MLLPVSILSKRAIGAEAERAEAEQKVTDLRHQLGELKKSHDALVIENKAGAKLEDHLSVVSDLKK